MAQVPGKFILHPWLVYFQLKSNRFPCLTMSQHVLPCFRGYLPYVARAKQMLLSSHRYVAYSSDVGESLRPVTWYGRYVTIFIPFQVEVHDSCMSIHVWKPCLKWYKWWGRMICAWYIPRVNLEFSRVYKTTFLDETTHWEYETWAWTTKLDRKHALLLDQNGALQFLRVWMREIPHVTCSFNINIYPLKSEKGPF